MDDAAMNATGRTDQSLLDPGDARMRRLYLGALVVEVMVIVALWVMARYFG